MYYGEDAVEKDEIRKAVEHETEREERATDGAMITNGDED